MAHCSVNPTLEGRDREVDFILPALVENFVLFFSPLEPTKIRSLIVFSNVTIENCLKFETNVIMTHHGPTSKLLLDIMLREGGMRVT